MRALVLSGGGSKGAFQVGVLKRWMGDLGIDYDIICGVSVGALNLAGLAHVPYGSPQAAIHFLESFWRSKVTGNESIYKRWFPFGRLHSLWKQSVYDSTPLKKLVSENIDLANVANNGRKLSVSAVCLETGEQVFATESSPRLVDWILASSSFPIFLTPVEIDGKTYSDGGIMSLTPIGQAIKLGADEIDVIMCADPWQREEWSSTGKAAVPDQIVRTFGLMSTQVARFDIEETGLKNKLPGYKNVKINVVMPSKPLLVDSLMFDPTQIDEMIKQGYEDADKTFVYE